MLLERGSIECAPAVLSEPELALKSYHIAYFYFQAIMMNPSRAGFFVAFLCLFVAYQLPEGLKMYELMLVVVPLAWVAGRLLGYRGLDAWYLGRSPRCWLLLAATFALAVGLKAAALGTGTALGMYSIASPGKSAGALAMAMPYLLFATFVSSISEDILTRGFVKRALPRLGAQWLFIPVSAGLYVLNHIYRLGNGPAEWITLFCYGLAYAAALHYSGSLWPAVGLHWGWNFANQAADSALDIQRLTENASPLLSAPAHLLMLAAVIYFRPRATSHQMAPAMHA